MPKIVDPNEVKARNVSVRTLAEARALFLSNPAPRIVLGAVALTLLARIYVAEWSYRDVVELLLVCAISPFSEWLIHKYFLHLKPIRGKEISSARRHRHHHQSPGLLREVLLKPVEVSVFIPLIAVTMLPIALPVRFICGGSYLAIWLTTILVSYCLLALYEWTHLLIHTQYQPRSAIYRSCHRSHRLHHFRNENYWLGVTTNLADRVLGTNPAKDDVPVSPTATTLAA